MSVGSSVAVITSVCMCKYFFKASSTVSCELLVTFLLCNRVICRVLIAIQHFLKSSALVEKMYSGMSHHEKYFTFIIVTNRSTRINVTIVLCYYRKLNIFYIKLLFWDVHCTVSE